MNTCLESIYALSPPYPQRWHRHFKSGQATGNERLFVHVYRVVGVDEGGGGGGGGGGLQQTMCGSKNYLWNQNAWVLMQSVRAAPGS